MTFRLANVGGRAALVDGSDFYDLTTVTDGEMGPDPMAAIAACDRLHQVHLGAHRPTGSLDGAEIGPPVPAPRNCFGVGLNYRSHVAETSKEVSGAPVVFTKFPSCISAPGTDVVLGGDAVDYEAEVVVVIGKGGRNIAAADAWAHVAGITGGQDISDRALQYAATPPHFDLGKSSDTYGPIGPVLVSPDCLENPDDIGVECRVNGELRQQASTAELIFGVPFLIEYLSSNMTLGPGDIIFTGTPEGVGIATGRLLSPGDILETTITGVGSFTNRCVAG